MIFLYLVAAIAGIFTFALSILPDPTTFFPMPTIAWEALTTASGWVSYILGLGGPDIKETLLTIIPLVIGLNVAVALWHIIRKWRPPVVGKFL